LANVNAFLRGAGHDHLAAAALSLALGAALIVVSIALTKIDWQSERQAFRWLVAVGSLLALISGALQSAEYATHLPGLWPYLLGYGVPVVGEIGLSLATALFSKAQQRSELRAVNAKIERAIITNLDGAISSFDPSTIQRRIDRSLNTIAARAVDGVTANLLAVYGAPAATPVVEWAPSGHEATPVPQETTLTPITSHNVPTPDDLAAARSAKKSARKGQVWRLIQTGQLSLNQLADQVNVTEKTIDRYISEFRQAGHSISVNGVVKLA
jgi:hypothetical protein